MLNLLITNITKTLAKIVKNNYYGKSDEVFYSAINVISAWNVKEEVITEQLALLKSSYGVKL